MNPSTLVSDHVISDFGTLAITPETSNVWLGRILSAYAEPQRYYHTLSHIAHMLSSLSHSEIQPHDNIAVKLAIYFHDIVYDPKAKDNEEQSILVFDSFIEDIGKDAIAGRRAENVRSMIRKTIKHAIPPEDIESLSPEEMNDSKVFLDLDLLILAESQEIYSKYASDIRLEYGHFDDTSYRQGRAAVMNNFLSRERIYFTDTIHAVYEDRARDNVKKEVDALLQAE